MKSSATEGPEFLKQLADILISYAVIEVRNEDGWVCSECAWAVIPNPGVSLFVCRSDWSKMPYTPLLIATTADSSSSSPHPIPSIEPIAPLGDLNSRFRTRHGNNFLQTQIHYVGRTLRQ